jgi:replication fork clamp-binding protein CrfC
MLDLVVRLWKQRPGKEAEVVDNCLAQVSRAAERVDRCSRAATERTVGEIHMAQHSILASNVVINADVKAVKSGVDGIQAAIVDGITRLESQLSGADREKHLQTATEKMLEAAALLKELRDGDSGWYQQPYLSLYGEWSLQKTAAADGSQGLINSHR